MHTVIERNPSLVLSNLKSKKDSTKMYKHKKEQLILKKNIIQVNMIIPHIYMLDLVL